MAKSSVVKEVLITADDNPRNKIQFSYSKNSNNCTCRSAGGDSMLDREDGK